MGSTVEMGQHWWLHSCLGSLCLVKAQGISHSARLSILPAPAPTDGCSRGRASVTAPPNSPYVEPSSLGLNARMHTENTTDQSNVYHRFILFGMLLRPVQALSLPFTLTRYVKANIAVLWLRINIKDDNASEIKSNKEYFSRLQFFKISRLNNSLTWLLL